jgi:hypothetical protein
MSMSNIQKTVQAVASILTNEVLKKMQASNLTVVSPRTVRFDIPKTVAGINRVKVTLQENDEFRIRTYTVEEVEDVANIAGSSLIKALADLTQTSPMSVLDPMTIPGLQPKEGE